MHSRTHRYRYDSFTTLNHRNLICLIQFFKSLSHSLSQSQSEPLKSLPAPHSPFPTLTHRPGSTIYTHTSCLQQPSTRCQGTPPSSTLHPSPRQMPSVSASSLSTKTPAPPPSGGRSIRMPLFLHKETPLRLSMSPRLCVSPKKQLLSSSNDARWQLSLPPLRRVNLLPHLVDINFMDRSL